MTTDQPVAAAPLRAHGLPDLLNVIPSLLGFHPTDSLVVVCIKGRRVVVTARVDLTAVATPSAADACFASVWERFPGSSCLAVAYSPDAVAAWGALEALAMATPWDVPVDAVHVDGERWYCSDEDEGRPYDPSASALAAEAAYRGVRVLPDRDALAATLAPSLTQAEMADALESVIASRPEHTVATALALASSVMRRPRVPTPQEASTLAVAAFSPAFVEAVVTGIDSATAERAVSLWTSVVRATPEFAGAAASVVLAMAAWVAGDGALLNVCLERAAPHVGDSQWFRFLDIAVRAALPPTQWDAVRSELLRGCGAA